MVVEDAETGYVGAVVRVEYGRIDLEDRYGKTRGFPLGPGYLLDGLPVILTARGAQRLPARGERHPARSRCRARVPGWPGPAGSMSRADTTLNSSRRYGERTCESKVSSSNISVASTTWWRSSPSSGPARGRRLGVLVDHLVAGSKEARIAEVVRRGPGGSDTLVVGHPYVDIWQAVKPQRVGLAAWPRVPRHIEWKHGVCDALGWPHADQADIAAAWRRIRSQVRDWTDLEPALIGRVEELIDFVTQPAGDE